MNISVIHSIPGRVRLSTPFSYSLDEANKLKYLLEDIDGIDDVYVYRRTGDIRITFHKNIKQLVAVLKDFKIIDLDNITFENPAFYPQKDIEVFDILRDSFKKLIFIKFLLPRHMRMIYTSYNVARYAWKGLKSILKGNLNVDVLDAAAVSIAFLSKEYSAAGFNMFLLGLGERLHEWTFKKSKEDLAQSLSIIVNDVMVVVDGEKIKKPLEQIEIGDVVEVSMGTVIPVDGEIIEGEAMVNQASFTGEPIAVQKTLGSTVFAGTVVESGSIYISVRKKYDDSRISEIIKLISDSENMKSHSQKLAESLADRLVKYNFIGAFVTYCFTNSLAKSLAFLMVDYSCALKLTIPIALLTAMRQAAMGKILIKGGKYIEELANADTIIFDKTGTLTEATPSVIKVQTFDGFSENEALKIAACLEEHFPHSVANAIIREAEIRNIFHTEENHSKPEYIVAHGIVATVNGSRGVIGSKHFVLEDESAFVSEEATNIIEDLNKRYSLLYLAIDGKLVAVICIDDPIRAEAKSVIKSLRDLGLKEIVMLTGDSEKAAEHVAKELGFDYYESEVMPEDKALYVDKKIAEGKTVIMIGDGINDSVALSKANVGIAMFKGADIAKAISDISINYDGLSSIVDVIKIAKFTKRRISIDYNFLISFNTALIVLGTAGVISNSLNSFLHNSATVISTFANMKAYPVHIDNDML